MALLIIEIEIAREITEGFGDDLDDHYLSSDDGLMINHDYVDVRGEVLEDVLSIVADEEEMFAKMEAGEFSDEVIAEVNEELWDSCSSCLNFDLGTAGAIYALSAAGHAPVSSCNGGVFGDSHALPNPWIIFYAQAGKLTPVLNAAKSANVGLVIGIQGTLELYADDIRKFPRFSRALINELMNHGVP